MRSAFFIVIALLLVALGAAPGRAEKRVALVIGNGAYQNLRPLKNPPGDARALAEALKKLDFDVDLGVDLTLNDMQRKVTIFARRAQAADVALAFFAGHGVQAPDPLGSAHAVNYLLPVDADIKDAADLGFLPTASDIIARLQAAGSVRILILDACRDNPIPQRLARGRSAAVARGLGAEPKTNGTLIAYSTQPDTIADDGVEYNSPFMQSLLQHIDEPGLDIRLLFADVRRDVIRRTNGKQTPETSDSLDGRFAFRKGKPDAPQQMAVVAPPARPSMRPHDDVSNQTEAAQEQIAIPDGATSEQIVQRLMETDILSGNIREIPREGSLLPDTWRFTPGTPREQLLQRMQQARDRVVQELWERRAPDLPLRSPQELVTLASIVEKETGRADERARVAAVLLNRLRQHLKLQSDPTIVYGLVGGKGTLGRPILKSEIEQHTPYNTYVIDGLPPGPIANPGRGSLEAAANPARTRDLYFVSDVAGAHAFAETFEQHQRNVARVRALELQQRQR